MSQVTFTGMVGRDQSQEQQLREYSNNWKPYVDTEHHQLIHTAKMHLLISNELVAYKRLLGIREEVM